MTIESLSLQLGHHTLGWEIFSLGSGLLAAVLLGISLIAYRRHKVSRFIPMSMAFGLFMVKVGIVHLDQLLPALQNELELAAVATEFGMLSMFFLSVVRK